MKTIILLTSNARKVDSMRAALFGLPIRLRVKNIWLPEIQSEDTGEVAGFAAQFGANKLNAPVIKMDSGFRVDVLGGFPGALVHIVSEKIGPVKFLKFLKQISNRDAQIESSIAFCAPGKKPLIFKGRCYGRVVNSLTISRGSFIDQLFIPYHKYNPQLKTMGELRKSSPESVKYFWGNAEEQFISWLKKGGW